MRERFSRKVRQNESHRYARRQQYRAIAREPLVCKFGPVALPLFAVTFCPDRFALSFFP
jgi:hypothetical protein